jgi:hypothetical protein
MQDAINFEREAVRKLPHLLGELLDRPIESSFTREVQVGGGKRVDASAEIDGRTWVFEIKSSSRPGIVADAQAQLADAAEALGATMAILVVPYMTAAGRRTASELGLDWIDLSGNASIRDGGDFYIHVRGNPNRSTQRGRPSSPFAPKSARITRELLVDPKRWWRQKDLAAVTELNDGHVSRTVRRLREERLLEESDLAVRPLDPLLLLNAWDDEYRFDRHDVVLGHASGSGIELAHDLANRLRVEGVEHAFTGMPAAWLLSHFTQFRLNSIYVDGDPREVADRVGLRVEPRGANVQLLGPDDAGVFSGGRELDQIHCVSPAQVYLDLRHLSERAPEAADELRERGLWSAPAA